MQVFLTGGTGYIGGAVADALHAAGHEIVALARSDSSAARLAGRGFRVHRDDLHNAAKVAGAAQGAGAFVHAAIAGDANAPLLEAALAEAVLDCYQGTGKTFLYTSGAWVMGDTGGKSVDETAPLHPPPLFAWRAGVEKTVLSGANRGVRSIVIRPAMVYGRGGGVVAMMVKSARENGLARYVGRGENHWTMVHVDDLADLYVLALEKAPPGSIYLAAAADPVKVRDLAEAASRSAGAAGRTQAWLTDEAFKTLGAWVEGLVLDQLLHPAKAQAELGWNPHRPSIFEELEHGSYRKRVLTAGGGVFTPLDPSING